MKLLPVGTCLAYLIAVAVGSAEWKTLKDEDGHVVEIVADFKIEELKIDLQGTTSFVADAVVDGERIGFSAALSKAHPGTITVLFQDQRAPVMLTDIDVRSVGHITQNLERRLDAELGPSPVGELPRRIVGLYRGYCPDFAASLAGPALVFASGVGITYDEHGKRISGNCFAMKLIVDGPLSRLTAYFHEEAGYGGMAAADRARSKWYESKSRKVSSQASQQTDADTAHR